MTLLRTAKNKRRPKIIVSGKSIFCRNILKEDIKIKISPIRVVEIIDCNGPNKSKNIRLLLDKVINTA